MEKKFKLVFDDNATTWCNKYDLNWYFVRLSLMYLNDMYMANGHLFAYQVYETLGIQPNALSHIFGWKKSGGGPDYLEFDVKEHSRDDGTTIFTIEFTANQLINHDYDC